MSDFQVKVEEARRRLPLRRLMGERGRGMPEGKKSGKCPYCQKDGAGFFRAKGRDGELFKCHHTSCPSGTSGKGAAWDEIGFLAHELGLSRKEAAITLVKEAGLWTEQERLAPSVMPGKAGRKLRQAGAVRAEDVPGTGEEPEPPEPPEAPPEEPERFSDLPSDSSSRAAAEPPTPPSGAAAPAAGSQDSSSCSGTDRAAAGETAVPGIGQDGADATMPPGPGPTEVPGGVASTEMGKAEGGMGNEGGDDGGGGDGRDAGEEGVPEALQALRWFYRRLHLTEADRDRLWRERGLTARTVAALGFRSNSQEANRELLLSMAAVFAPSALVESGLWSAGRRAGDGPKPNPQFHGMSLRPKRDAGGHKVRDEEGAAQLECVWDEPVLIPYFDREGKLVHLRPHKGMMREKAPRLYVVRPPEDWTAVPLDAGAADGTLRGLALVTEGEFKAAALWQVFGELPQVAALPGITMAKPLFGEIEDWLAGPSEMRKAEGGMRNGGAAEWPRIWQVVVGYDNEEKGDPALAGFVRDEWRRYDTQAWARYLASQLAKEGFDARVCVLPKGWRAASGKADWDGALAARLKALWGPWVKTKNLEPSNPEPLNLEPLRAEFWEAVRGRVQAEWRAVVRSAAAVSELWQTGLFDSQAERLIRNALERIAYEPKLPIGDDGEVAAARRLQRLVGKLKGDGERLAPAARGFLMLLAKAYLDTKGGYYEFKRLSDPQAERWMKYLTEAAEREDVEVRRACEIALKGIPQRISNFFLKPHYVLRRPNGKRCRLVTIHNIHGGRSKLLQLPSDMYAQPSKWREWLLDSDTAAAWEAGERQLQKLHQDVGREVAFKDVEEIATRGWHPESRCWFFRDVCYLPDGKELLADRDGIFWVPAEDAHEAAAEGHARRIRQPYQLSTADHEGQTFKQGEPRMRTEVAAWELVKEWEEVKGLRNADEGPVVGAMFREISRKLYETIGGYGGYLVLGSVLTFGAGPEIYQKYSGFPGLWVHGEPRQGKTSVARWMLGVWGMHRESGIALKDSTKVGLSIALQQYHNLPVWFEEFQADAEKWLQEKLKNVYDRTAGSKKTFEEGDRKILAGAIVSGVATSMDAQLKSRYAHVQVSASSRLGTDEEQKARYDWFQAESDKFFLLGRYLMRHRKEFARLVIEGMEKWLASPGMSGVDARARIVHGAAYAAFVALVQMVESHAAQELTGFRNYLIGHCREAVAEVQEQVNVDQFWRDLLDALKGDAFGPVPSDLKRIFKVAENTRAVPRVTEEQTKRAAEDRRLAWTSYLLYFQPGPVLSMLREWKRRQGKDLPLDRNDLRAQMRTRRYWVEPKGDCHRQRFTGNTPEGCWCVDLDWHELGFRPVSDAEFQESLYRDGEPEQGNFLKLSEEWYDPRKGDLMMLVDVLTRKQS